ncbi:alginate export family protein [Burkholderia vietnamiensis]|nr:alginate export family protein [Burkholderia vietnamiensis]KVR90134.1 hypothetical protein WK28_22510 [Burkholderia vietnamiensis]MEC4599603.1 alginate export family protein [Burkholderia vietnamiensis]
MVRWWPNVALPGTAGKGRSWAGIQVQLRADCTTVAPVTGMLKAAQRRGGDAIEQARRHDVHHVGAESKQDG